MSFDIPKQAIPVASYSRKATFETERTPLVTNSTTGITTGGKPIANRYVLMIRKESDTIWKSYNLSRDAKFVYVDDLLPQTLYVSKWKLVGSLNIDLTVNNVDEISESDEFTFKTRHLERFQLRPAIPVGLSTDYPAAIQGELDELNNYINTIDDEKAIERLTKEGVGKLGDRLNGYAEIRIVGGSDLFMSNGYFQSGSGFTTDDERWYPGARVWTINDPSGYISLNEDNMKLPTGVLGDFYGYMGAYWNEDGTTAYSIIWSKEVLSPRPDGRWLIGRVSITDAGLYDSVNVSMTDFVPDYAYLFANAGGGSGGGSGDEGAGAKLQLNYLNDVVINDNYVVADGWKTVLTNKIFTIDGENALISFSIISGALFTSVGSTEVRSRLVIDPDGGASRREINLGASINSNPFSGAGALYLDNLTQGVHTIRIEYSATGSGALSIPIMGLRLEVVEFVGAETENGPSQRSGRDIPMDLLNIENPTESIRDAVARIEDSLHKKIEDAIKSLAPGQTLSMDFLIANLARALVGQGETNPSSLTRVDAAFIIPELYGQDGVTIDLDGEAVESPDFELEGNLTYDSVEKTWVV